MSDLNLGIALRPTSFTDIIGHDNVVPVLQAKLDKGEVPRALMFVGPAGTGKTTLARIVARAVQGWEFFSSNQEPDCIEVNAADMRGIDATRELVENTQTYPMTGRYRVVILDEAHQLTKESQNCLLKPMEAENSATVWIICTTETHKIIPAIRTRCQVFELTTLSKKNVHDLLTRAASHLGRTTVFEDFEKEAISRSLFSPRPLLNAFENYHNGMPAAEAVNGQTQAYGPQHFDIAKAVVYGLWDKDCQVWGAPSRSVKALLTELEDQFKKKDKDKETAGDAEETKEDVVGRPEASRGLRAVVGALLKNLVIKQGSLKAAEALHILANAAPAGAFDAAIEYPCTVGVLYRINLKMQSR